MVGCGGANYYKVLSLGENVSKGGKENVVVSNITTFKERLQEKTFRGILEEYLRINNKPLTYIDSIKDLLEDSNLETTKKLFKGRHFAKVCSYFSLKRSRVEF